MRNRWLISTLALAACAGSNDQGAAGARLVAPQSLATVSQQRPTLRWLSTESAMPVVDLCADRRCASPLAIKTEVAADHQSAVPTQALPAGWVYWRVRSGSVSSAATSATWQFWVGHASATSPVDTSIGAVLDVNGDGRPDFLVGAPGQGGRVFLYLGTDHPSSADWNAATSATRIELTSPDPTRLQFGYGVASAGDVNGDGYGDFLIGTRNALQPPGAVSLYLGGPTPRAEDWNGPTAPRRIDLTSPDGSASVGSIVAGAGDVNGDGYADFLVASESNGQVPGTEIPVTTYVYFGSATPTATAWSDPTSGARVQLGAGGMVAAAGDVNGDGYSDFLVGDFSPNAPPSHLYFGEPAPKAIDWNGEPTAPLRIDLISPDGIDGLFGGAVASAGDVDGDGYSDFLIGASEAHSGVGAAHLYFGSAAPMPSDWNGMATPSKRVDLAAQHPAEALFGASLAPAGDVDGDGRGDFLIGEPLAGGLLGIAHLYLGAGAGDPVTAWQGAAPTARIDLANPIANNGDFGTGVAGVGDLNGDGYIDFVVSQFGVAELHLGVAQPSAASWSGATNAQRLDLTSPGIEGHQANYGQQIAGGH